MARQRSTKVAEVKAKLCLRVREGVHRPGDRFLSTRAVAGTFEISYQTAHRILQELCDEGLLERRFASGTYIAGGQREFYGVQFIFHPRARRPHSFGARLLEGLIKRLDRDRVAHKLSWALEKIKLDEDYFPVIWESPVAVEKSLRRRRPALLLNERPQPGLSATLLDSVSIDDFSGGVCAAQLLLRERKSIDGGAHYAVLSGPAADARSSARRDGFLSLLPRASVIAAQSWFFEDGFKVAARVVRRGSRGIFCCNDRLAEAIAVYCRRLERPCPKLVGFDDAPVAEQLNLTTIAIPWDEMIAGAADLIKRRLDGDASTAHQLILTPQPVIR